MKIMYLKSGICNKPSLEEYLGVKKNLLECNLSFDAFSNHLTSSIINKHNRTKMLMITNPRILAGNETTNLSTKSAQSHSRGRKGSRFNQTGHFTGRGRGRGSKNPTYNSTNCNNTKVPKTIYLDGKTLYPRKIYQRSKYSQLTPSQKS